ncbi:MAG: hypothetical protein NT164_04860 [Verrucomicrobiae bacterium]|nr:hypothetical protein [Verrucomicrobiae bacterium]
MPVPKKILLILVIVIVALTGVTLSVNLIIQSATVQEQFHQTAQKIVGMPITMGKLSFNPFMGFHLTHVAITDASHRSLDVSVLDFMPTWRLLLPQYWGRSLNNIEKWGGILSARKVTLNNSFSLEYLKAHLKKRAASFLIDPFSSQVADGKLTGSFLLEEENGHSPYQLNIHFTGISLKELIKGVPSIEGKVQGTFFMKGVLEDLEKKEGEGMLEVIGMQLKSGGPLAQIGQLLGIQELQLLKFDEAVATYAVTPHQLVVKSLKLHSNNLMVRGHGTISYEGVLHLNALLLVNAKLQSRLQGLLPIALLVPSGEAGFVALPFEITGSLDHPHSTLLEHMALPAINSNVQGLIQQIFKF